MAVERERTQQRIPVPSLFVGPPSQRRSSQRHESIGSDVIARDSEKANQHPQRNFQNAQDDEFSRLAGQGSQPATIIRAKGNDVDHSIGWQANAMWAEMQSTLEEVELSAASRANVFSNDHARALEELRKAQVELAQAWASSETDSKEQEHESMTGGKNIVFTAKQHTFAGGAESSSGLDRDPILRVGDNVKGAKPNTQGKSQLEDTADNDIKLARQRRLTNDQQFDKVSKGINEVVSKLEVVAKKMRNVEVESQEIWSSDKDSIDRASAI